MLTICVSLEKVEENHLVDGWLQLEVLTGQVLGNGLQLLQLGKPAPTTSVRQELAILFYYFIIFINHIPVPVYFFYWAVNTIWLPIVLS